MTNILHRPVVVGIDGSAEARRAASYGAWEAHRRQLPLRLVYAYVPTPMWYPTNVVIDEYAWERHWVHTVLSDAKDDVARAYPDLAVETAVVGGGASGALVDESERASLVVVGTQASGGFLGHLSGSIAAQVAAHAGAPVVVLRGPAAGPGGPAAFTGRPVVVGVDGSEASTRAIEFAVEQALARQAELRAVFAWSVVDVYDGGPIGPEATDIPDEQKKAERLLAEALAGWSQRCPDLKVIRIATHNPFPLDALVSESTGAGLIVVGSRGHGGFLGLRIGSTVDGLIRHAQAPVAVIHREYRGEITDESTANG